MNRFIACVPNFIACVALAAYILTAKMDPTSHMPFLLPLPTYTQTTSKKQVHLFPFMLPDAMSPLANMYRRVTRLMEAAGTDEQNTKAKTALVNGLMDMSRWAVQR